jgi:hypothetical protein
MMAASAVVAQPANDLCSTATSVVDGNNTIDNRGSTRDSTSPCSRGGANFSGTEVWYTYTAPATGTRNFIVRDAYRNNGAEFDSQLTIYDGCGGTALACDDDSGLSLWSKIYHFPVTQGTTYTIRLGNWGVNLVASRQGAGILEISAPPAPVAFDDCDLATTISGQPLSVPFDTTNLTPSDTQGWDADFSRDGWFAWTPSVSGIAYVDGCEANGVNGANNLALSLYDNCGNAPLLTVASFRDPPTAFCTPKLCFEVVAGTTYRIRLGAPSAAMNPGVQGNLQFRVEPLTQGLVIPPGAIAEPGACDAHPAADLNGGCAVTPNAFTSINLCETRWGTASTRLAPLFNDTDGVVEPSIDADWYEINLANDQAITITGESEFPPDVYIYVGCPATQVRRATFPFPQCNNAYSFSLTSPPLIAGPYSVVIFPIRGYAMSSCDKGDKYWLKVTGETPCPVTTQYCCRGTTCTTVTAGACTGTSAGTAFTPVSSCGTGATTATCCFADYDHNGARTIDDIFVYLNAWFGSSPYTKFGGDGVATANIDDIFVYLNAWFTGCN